MSAALRNLICDPKSRRPLGRGRRLLRHRLLRARGTQSHGAARTYLHGALGLQHAAARRDVGVHLDLVGVDGRVEHDPRTTAQLGARRQVDEEGLLVLANRVDNVRAVFKDFLKHVTLAAGEAAPVGHDKQRQLLAVVKVLDGLGSLWRAKSNARRFTEASHCDEHAIVLRFLVLNASITHLVRAVGIPDLAGLLHNLLLRVWVGRVGGNHRLDRAGLGQDDADGLAVQTRAAHDNRLRPPGPHKTTQTCALH